MRAMGVVIVICGLMSAVPARAVDGVCPRQAGDAISLTGKIAVNDGKSYLKIDSRECAYDTYVLNLVAAPSKKCVVGAEIVASGTVTDVMPQFPGSRYGIKPDKIACK